MDEITYTKYYDNFNKNIINVKEEKNFKFLGPLFYNYINIYQDKVILKSGIWKKKIDIENIETIYLKRKTHRGRRIYKYDWFFNYFYEHARGSYCEYFLIIRYKNGNKYKEITFQIEKMDEIQINELFNCFEFIDNNENTYNRKVYIGSTEKLGLFVIALFILLFYMRFADGEFINVDKYNLCHTRFYDDTSIYEDIKEEEFTKDINEKNFSYFFITNNQELNKYKEQIKKNKSIYREEVVIYIEEEYEKAKKEEQILFVAVAKKDTYKLYYKINSSKVNLVLKPPGGYGLNKTCLYTIALDKKYENGKIKLKEIK